MILLTAFCHLSLSVASLSHSLLSLSHSLLRKLPLFCCCTFYPNVDVNTNCITTKNWTRVDDDPNYYSFEFRVDSFTSIRFATKSYWTKTECVPCLGRLMTGTSQLVTLQVGWVDPISIWTKHFWIQVMGLAHF